MAYSELVKNFDNIRMVMRDFYVYGFKSKADFNDKRGRTYDNDNRRIKSKLDDNKRIRQNTKSKHNNNSIERRKIKNKQK